MNEKIESRTDIIFDESAIQLKLDDLGNVVMDVHSEYPPSILLEFIDTDRLKKKILSSIDAIKASVKDSKPVSWDDLYPIAEMSDMLQIILASRI